MRNYKIPLLVLLVLGVIFACYFWLSNDDKHKNTTETSVISPKNKKTTNNNLVIQDKLKQRNVESNQLKKKQISKDAEFYKAPVLIAELTLINFSHCIESLNSGYDQKDVETWKTFNPKSPAQLKLTKELNSYCEDINSKHPEYMLSNEEDIIALQQSVTTDNELGKILTKVYNNENITLDPKDLASKMQLLKSTDPNLLLNATSYFRSNLIGNLDIELTEIIKSNDIYYASFVRGLALKLYACEAGANCGVYSSLMTNLCLQRNLCGNDFNDILNNKMPEGIRADILLVFNHLKTILG